MTEDQKDRKIRRLETLNWTQIIGMILLTIEHVAASC